MTVLLGLELTGQDNLYVEIFQYQGINCFNCFRTIPPRNFMNWSYLNPGDSITYQKLVPASIYEGLADVLYYQKHLTASNNADIDTPLN